MDGQTSIEKAVLKLGDQDIELPVFTGSEGEKGIDISTLRKETGYITLDPGYVNTGMTRSSICFIDGEEGILRYRGYPIEELAANSNFVESSYLLIHGELPNPEEYEKFRQIFDKLSLLKIYQIQEYPDCVVSSKIHSSEFFEKENEMINSFCY